jgi:Kef-type K+ transport system membrane component KefB
LPFATGAALAIALYPFHHHVRGHSVSELAFVLFVATAMSVTAFPVLAAILSERGLRRTPLGELALGSAAAQDAVGWLLLALALSVAAAKNADVTLRTVTLLAACLLVMFAAVRPLLRALLARDSDTTVVLVVAVATAVAAAGVTQLIGIHEVLGAFAAGIAFPRTRATREWPPASALMPLTMSMLLPVFFLTPGLAINIGTISIADFGWLALITTVACAAKLLGVLIPARAVGIDWREATPLAVLLNTRGLMELVVLTVGYTDGVLDAHLYTVLVLMAIATTMITCPALNALERRGLHCPREPTDGRFDVLPLPASGSS